MKEAVLLAKDKYSHIANLEFKTSNFLEMSSPTYDLVVCLQTLEHIEDSKLDLFFEKLIHSAKIGLVLSVPREPFWCIANLLRGKYVPRFGNTPDHLQHFKTKNFEKKIKEFLVEYKTIQSHSPLKLWTITKVVL